MAVNLTLPVSPFSSDLVGASVCRRYLLLELGSLEYLSQVILSLSLNLSVRGFIPLSRCRKSSGQDVGVKIPTV